MRLLKTAPAGVADTVDLLCNPIHYPSGHNFP